MKGSAPNFQPNARSLRGDQRPDILNEHGHGHRVESSFGNDDVGILLRRFDELHMMVEHIRALKNNVPISHPVYSFVEHDRLPETVAVKPSKVIIVDGILIL